MKKEEQIKQLEKNRKIQVHFSLHFTVHSHFRCIAFEKNKLGNKTQFGAKTKNEAADFSQFVVFVLMVERRAGWRKHDWAGIHDGPLLGPLHKNPNPRIPDSQDPISTLRRRQAYPFSKTFKVFLWPCNFLSLSSFCNCSLSGGWAEWRASECWRVKGWGCKEQSGYGRPGLRGSCARVALFTAALYDWLLCCVKFFTKFAYKVHSPVFCSAFFWPFFYFNFLISCFCGRREAGQLF